MNNINIYIIVVLYKPTDGVISKWDVLARSNLSTRFCFVDNSPVPTASFNSTNSYYIPLKTNKGIAKAQNIGIELAIKDGADYIIFFDQDSDVDNVFCNALIEEFKRIKNKVPNLAMLGPTIVNKETQDDYKTKAQFNDGFAIVNTLISSGTIVDAKVLEEVGLMDSKLFIDSVDFEWCWRAYSKGYICAKTALVRLPHKVGQKNKSLFGIPFIVSTPFRYYYQYRNWLWLLRKSYVPKTWKQKTSIRKIAELLVIPLLTDKKLDTIYNMFRGLRDGLKVNNR